MAIRGLAVRGAPAIGIAAAYGVALAAAGTPAHAGPTMWELERAGDELRATRPTAANLGWAIDRMIAVARQDGRASGSAIGDIGNALLREALAIEREDREACDAIGSHGAGLVPDGANVLTHCNTGMLCTGGIGTAQGVILTAHRSGKRVHVWVDETRPLLQGARLTAWELGKLGIPRTLVADGAAASMMAAGRVDLVIVGADRIAADGSVANKIGTYGLAVSARHHRVPFYVAAPTSTIDLQTPTGADIVIEERDPREVTAPLGHPVAAPDTPVANPAFDVTPPSLVSAIVSERGVLREPYASSLRTSGAARRSA